MRNPNGRGTGWVDRNGRVWVPDDHDGTHAPHWDVQDLKVGATLRYIRFSNLRRPKFETENR